MNPRVRTLIFLLLLFVAAWMPRALALDHFVTIDERKWLARSANFTEALSRGDLAATFQREHPGVTVMWAGTLGLLQKYPGYADDAPGQFAWDREFFEEWLLANTALKPLELLAAGRWWIVLAVTLAVCAGYFPLRHLFDEQTAFFATLFSAWTPFYIALSRQLHPDGLVASLTFLALLLFLAWLYGEQKLRYLIASSLVMGLAWLTKTPAILLAPTGGLLLLLDSARQHDESFPKLTARVRTGSYILWGIGATTVFVALWPAMWLDPIGTLQRVAGEMGAYVEAHVNPNYFWGQVTSDPGWLFYPVAYVFRITPVTLFGLIGAGFAALRRDGPFAQPRLRRVSLALVVFAVIFATMMSFGAKKFDRYMLPAMLALGVVAALGWTALGWTVSARWLVARRSLSNQVFVSLLCLVVLVHGALGFLHFPYYFTYYNLLVGGSRTAPKVMFVGWGDGLDAAARWLNQQPDAKELRVATWYHDGPFSYFFDGRATGISSGSPLAWLDTDYAIVYINQRQRGIPSKEAIGWFNRQPAVHTVRAAGIDLARIYDLRATGVPDFVEIGKENAADFGGKIRLAAYRVNAIEAYPGDRIPATFYLQALEAMAINYNVLVRLVDQAGNELWRDEGWPWGAPTSEWPAREIRPDGHEIIIPEGAQPGLYVLRISFYDPDTLQPLQPTTVGSETPFAETERDVALISVGDKSDILRLESPDISHTLGTFFRLSGADIPATVSRGEVLTLGLQWESLRATAVEYTTFVHVVSAAGETVAQLDRPPFDGFGHTRLWRPGQRLVDRWKIPLPDDLSAGNYTLLIGMYTAESGRLQRTRDGAVVGGDAIELGPFSIRP